MWEPVFVLIPIRTPTRTILYPFQVFGEDPEDASLIARLHLDLVLSDTERKNL